MISKFGIGILVTAAMFLVAAPSNSLAATSAATKNQIKQLTSKLKKLPNGAAPANVVSKYVTKLAKLDPRKSKKYYKLGLQKLAVNAGARGNATKIAAAVDKILRNSGLSASQIAKFQKQVNQENLKYNPVPYQALVLDSLAGALA